MNITMNVDESTIATILEGMTTFDVDSLVSILTNDGNSCVSTSVSYLVSSIITDQKNNKSFINLIKTLVDFYSKESDKTESTDSASTGNNTETTNDCDETIREYYSVAERIKGCLVDTGNVYVCEHGVNNDTTYLIDNYGRFKRDIPESERASFVTEFKLKPIDDIIAFIKANVDSATNSIIRLYVNNGISTLFTHISDTNGEIVSFTDEDGNEVSVMNGDIIEVENDKIKLYKSAYTETGYICTEIPIDNGMLINNLIIIEVYMDGEFITQAEVWDIMNNWYKKSLEQLIEPDKYYVVKHDIKIDDVSFTIGDIISFTDDSVHVSLTGNSNKAYMYKIGRMISEDTEHKTFYPVSSYDDALMVAKLANFFSKR